MERRLRRQQGDRDSAVGTGHRRREASDGFHQLRNRVQRALADAVQDFAARDLPVDVELGAVQKWAGIPLPGCDAGCFDVVEASPESGTGTPTAGAFGTNFLLTVELPPDGPRAHTLLTYGQSANPASPHFSDQPRRFSRKQWVMERSTPAEVPATRLWR